ncbi:MAG TPA: altronate dehydrogenase [Planctomycetaceae bacterium]|jgi:tagaturonate reductase|nr:altronate dehydrogenase [Planctomycetaceae bacterium]
MSAASSRYGLPETVLQFGAGRFLRAFTDRFLHQANAAGQDWGRVVVVQSTPGNRAEALNSNQDGFHVVVRGLENGETVDRVEPVHSIARAIPAVERWGDVLEVARSPHLRLIVSNATEAGYAVDPQDTPDAQPPASFPAKLTRVLWERFQARLPGVTIIPCELIEHNAVVLQGIVDQLAGAWNLPGDFRDWLMRDCGWVENLVDCIVTPAPSDHPLLASDPLLVTAEPYMLWALARPAAGRADVSLFGHPAIQWVDSVDPYYLRKVRILNGLHTAMAAKFGPAGFETVLQVLRNRNAVTWLRGVAYEEILPTIAHRVEDGALFADQVFERFANPFLAHRLSDIAKNHEAKVNVRLRPTVADYQRLYGRAPRRLSEVVPGV